MSDVYPEGNSLITKFRGVFKHGLVRPLTSILITTCVGASERAFVPSDGDPKVRHPPVDWELAILKRILESRVTPFPVQKNGRKPQRPPPQVDTARSYELCSPLCASPQSGSAGANWGSDETPTLPSSPTAPLPRPLSRELGSNLRRRPKGASDGTGQEQRNVRFS